jgi:hypothetical protein
MSSRAVSCGLRSGQGSCRPQRADRIFGTNTVCAPPGVLNRRPTEDPRILQQHQSVDPLLGELSTAVQLVQEHPSAGPDNASRAE